MPNYLVDLTVSDAELSAPLSAPQIVGALRKVRGERGHVEVWQSDTDHRFWRMVLHEDAMTMADALAGAERIVAEVREQLEVPSRETLGIQVSVRDGRYRAFDIAPPPTAAYL